MRNRTFNSNNPYQGNAKKVLCVCSAGLLRSPTAAIVLQKEFGYNTRAVGLDQSHALIPIDDVLVHWADEIVVMDFYQEIMLDKLYSVGERPVIVLDIEDEYSYMDETLQELILENYKREKRYG